MLHSGNIPEDQNILLLVVTIIIFIIIVIIITVLLWGTRYLQQTLYTSSLSEHHVMKYGVWWSPTELYCISWNSVSWFRRWSNNIPEDQNIVLVVAIIIIIVVIIITVLLWGTRYLQRTLYTSSSTEHHIMKYGVWWSPTELAYCISWNSVNWFRRWNGDMHFETAMGSNNPASFLF